MADRINFSKKINDSVQVGDELYWIIVNLSTGDAVAPPMSSGEITEIGEKYVKVDTAAPPQGTTPLGPGLAHFYAFKKPEHAHASLPYGGYTNVSSLKGYYAEATFTTAPNVTTKQELFAVGSEITVSSK